MQFIYCPWAAHFCMGSSSFCPLFCCEQLSGPCNLAWSACGQQISSSGELFRTMGSEWAARSVALQLAASAYYMCNELICQWAAHFTSHVWYMGSGVGNSELFFHWTTVLTRIFFSFEIHNFEILSSWEIICTSDCEIVAVNKTTQESQESGIFVLHVVEH